MQYAISDDPESTKRRSTRIVQSIPLIVEGTDALGRSFRERTSTLIINCHGCKYLSKYFVPQDSWVTLEVPQPEAGCEPRRVRARVTWIYRPRTVQELLQIGVEFETCGNIWGIAFPPEDWFPYPESEVPAIPVAALAPSTAKAQPAPQQTLEVVPLAPKRAEPVPEDLERTIRAITARIVAQESTRLTGELRGKAEEAAQRAMDEVARSYGDQLIRRALERIEEARKAQTAALSEEWNATFRASLNEARQQLTTGLRETAAELRENFVQQVHGDVGRTFERIEQVSRELGQLQEAAQAELEQTASRLTVLRGEIREAEENVSTSVTERMRQLYETGQDRSAELLGTVEAAVSDAEEQLTIARTRFLDTVQSAQAALIARQKSIQQTLEALTRRVHEMQQAAETAMASTHNRAASMRQEIETLAEHAHTSLDAHIQQLEQTTSRLSAEARGVFCAFSGQLDARAEEAQGKVTATGEAVLAGIEARHQELEHQHMALEQRAREVLADTNTGLENMRRDLDAAVQSSLAEHHANLRSMEQAIERLEQETTACMQRARLGWREQLESDMAVAGSDWNAMLDTAVQLAAERLRQCLEAAAPQAVEEITSRSRQQLRDELQEVDRATQALHDARERSTELLEAREEQLRETMDQVVRQASLALTDTSGQLHKDFEATAQARQQQWFQEIDAKGTDTIHSTFEAFYKASEWYQKKASTSMESLLGRLLEEAQHRLRDQAGELSRLFASELNHQSQSFTDHTRALIEEAAEELTEGTQSRLAQIRETSLAALEDELHRMTAKTLQELTERQHEARHDFAQLAGESVQQHGARLASISNEWVAATVQALHTRAQGTIEALAHSTEEKVHQALSHALSDFADTIRGRLLGIPTKD